MKNYQEALEIIKNRNSKIKTNHKIGSRDIANEELKEINKVIDKVLPTLQQAIDKAIKYDEKETKIKEYIKQLEKAQETYWDKKHRGTNEDIKNFYCGMEHSVQCCINDLKNILGMD
mgnify:CR=1 FL=1